MSNPRGYPGFQAPCDSCLRVDDDRDAGREADFKAANAPEGELGPSRYARGGQKNQERYHRCTGFS
jgi:hypothetical protein